MQRDVNWPLGWPVGGYPGPPGIVPRYLIYQRTVKPSLAELHVLHRLHLTLLSSNIVLKYFRVHTTAP